MLGPRLKRLRQSRGLSAREVAEKAGLTTKGLFDLESDRFAPKLSTLQAIAEALGVTMAALFVPDDAPLMDKVVANLSGLPTTTLEFLAEPESRQYIEAAQYMAGTGLQRDDVTILLRTVKTIRDR